jgi:hypothetical protein
MDRNYPPSQRQHVFVFAPPRYGPEQIGIQFPRYDAWGNEVIKCMIVDLGHQPADRVLERGEQLIVTADNMALLRFIEDSGMFRRAGLISIK